MCREMSHSYAKKSSIFIYELLVKNVTQEISRPDQAAPASLPPQGQLSYSKTDRLTGRLYAVAGSLEKACSVISVSTVIFPAHSRSATGHVSSY